MKAIHGAPGPLAWRAVPDPVPGPGEVTLRVRAAGVNRADLAQRAGRYPPPPGASEILGLEVAGEVLTAPEGSGWRPGDRAHALLAGGGYAERVAVPARMLLPTPDGLTDVEAAAMPEAHLTAFSNLVLEAGLRAGERVLIHAGASGVGTAAILQARALGAEVATTSSGAKAPLCRGLGAAWALDRHDPAWPARLRDAWGGVDVILDPVGAATTAANLELLDVGGRLVWISTLGGRTATLDVGVMMRKRLTVKGTTLRGRPLDAKIALRDAFQARFGADVARGGLRLPIHATFDVRHVEEAHAQLRANATAGKVVLTVP